MPELKPLSHGNPATEGSQIHSSMDTSSYGNSTPFMRHYSKDYFCRNLPLGEPSLQGLVETEVFVGDEDEESFENLRHNDTDAYTPNSLVISYQKDAFLHPLNSVKEDIEAEAAEEESCGNYHSLDYLSLGCHSSLSSSVVSSTSVDDCQDYSFGFKSPYVLSSMSSKGLSEGSNPVACRLLNGKNINGSTSPLLNTKTRGSPRQPYTNSDPNKSNSRTLTKECYNYSKNNQSKCTSKCQPNLYDHFKNSQEKKSLIWHNPAKSDRILTTDKESYTLYKREKENKKNDKASSDVKFNSLPRKKEKKSDKDIVAETYGTLGRNRSKRAAKENNSKTSPPCRDISRDNKNTLDKYATLPRKKAREISSKLQEQKSMLQYSKSSSKSENQPSKASPLLTTSLTSSINSRLFNSPSRTSTNKGQDKNKPDNGSLSKLRRHSSLKEKRDKFSSPSKHPRMSSKKSVQIQVSIPWDGKEDELQSRFDKLSEDYALLQRRLSAAESNALEVEELRMEANELRKTVEMEKQEKEEIQEELDRTSTRVKNMLTSMEDVEKEFNNRGDSLIEMQGQLQNSADINVKLQEKLNQSEDFSVKLRKDLDKSLAAQKILLQQVQDLETEGREMGEFMAEEKNALSECLKEAEAEVGRVRKDCEELSTRLQQKDEEARHMVRLAEERRKEYLSLQSEMCSMQSQTQDIMVCQGAEVSGTSIALTNLITRLQTLTEKLIQDYTISENDIENVVTPADSDSSLSSSTNGTPEHQKSPVRISNRTSSPRKPASFMQSFLNAMRIAQNTSRVLSHSLKSSGKDSTANQVQCIEGRKSPDGSESRTFLEVPEEGINGHGSSLSLLDQVTEVDVLLTRFLKVCCVLKNDADIILSELEDENERLCNQLQLQHQMIDQHYSKFESLSVFETNARKELRMISKDLEIANETLHKVCREDGVKDDVKKLGEDLERMSCSIQQLESMHADKERNLDATLQKFTHAHGYDLGAMLIPDGVQRFDRKPNASHRMHHHHHMHHSLRPNPKDHRHNRGSPKALPFKNIMKDDFTNCNNSSFTEIAFDDHSTSVNEVDLIINHVLKTLEEVPDVVSGCSILKNLYINLNTQESLDRAKTTSTAIQHECPSPEVNTSLSTEVETILEENSPTDRESNIPYDCNANPDPGNLPSDEAESDLTSNIDPNTLLPLLTNETAL